MPAYARTGAVIAVLLGIGAGQAFAQVKLGAVLSVTGPASFLGDPEKKTLEMYVDHINTKGGVNGQKLQLVVYDDGADANAARTFATRLVEEDNVVAMVGGTTTGATLAMIPVFEEAQIPLISLAGAVQVIEPVRKWVFKTPHTDRMACQRVFADLKRRNLTTVALISGRTPSQNPCVMCVAVAPRMIGIAQKSPTGRATATRLRSSPTSRQTGRAGGDQSGFGQARPSSPTITGSSGLRCRSIRPAWRSSSSSSPVRCRRGAARPRRCSIRSSRQRSAEAVVVAYTAITSEDRPAGLHLRRPRV